MRGTRYLTMRDTGEILGVSRTTVLRWIQSQRLESSIVGTRHRIYPENLFKYLKSLGNSDEEMAHFSKDLYEFLEKKRREK